MAMGKLGQLGKGFGRLGSVRGAGGSLPQPPTGFLFITDDDGSFITDDDGAYILDAA